MKNLYVDERSNEYKLSMAIKQRDEDAIRRVLDAGYDPNTIQQNGNTFAFSAAWQNNRAALEILREYGADLNALSQGPRSILMAAAMNIDVLIYILEIYPDIDINFVNAGGVTALMQATSRPQKATAHLRCIEMLIDKGAEVNAQADGGYTALISACIWGDEDMALLLLKHGANHGLADNSGKKPFDYLSPELKEKLCGQFEA